MLCVVLYFKNSNKSRFSDLNKRVKNDYIIDKSKYPKTIAVV